MRVVLQRVKEASVTIEGQVNGAIKAGILVLLGIEDADTPEDIEWLCNKICNLRIFNDSKGVMNLSLQDIKGEVLVISQFTLHANIKKGNRPSYIKAAKPNVAIPLYEEFNEKMQLRLGKPVATGIFGAHMEVTLINDGPVTILMDSKNKE
ncbi:MAG: D-aminoacyl-tRNA deacylase [Gillisia sp.]